MCSGALQVLYIQAFVLVFLLGKFMGKVFFGQLRAAEMEVRARGGSRRALGGNLLLHKVLAAVLGENSSPQKVSGAFWGGILDPRMFLVPFWGGFVSILSGIDDPRKSLVHFGEGLGTPRVWCKF